MIVLALYNLKGGVGKTAAAVNLAYLASAEGYKTLVWDLDPQGSASFYFSAGAPEKNQYKKLIHGETELSSLVITTPYENLSLIPADLSSRHADVLLSDVKQSRKKIASLLGDVKKSFDLAILDCPPGISLIHDNIFNAASWILMPNIPTTLSIRAFETVMNYFQEHDFEKNKIKCFFSMVDGRKNLHHEVMGEFYKDKLFFKNYIPYLSDVEKMGVQQAPVETYAASSYAAQCYRDLWKEVKKPAFSRHEKQPVQVSDTTVDAICTKAGKQK